MTDLELIKEALNRVADRWSDDMWRFIDELVAEIEKIERERRYVEMETGRK